MRLFRLEIKRLLTSRRTIILLALALGLSVVMALLPISFESVNRPNSDGTITELSGLDAIRYKRGLYAPFNGQVTPQRVQSALITYQDCVQTYGLVEEKGFPLTINVETILPIRPLLKGLTEAYADPLTGAGADWMALDAQDIVPHYYDQCAQHLRDVLYNEQRHYPTAQQKASALYAQVYKPFTLYAGFSKDAFDYIELYLLLLALLGVALAAPIFSGDYQSGADDIQRTTRFGRKRLAVTKIAACLAVWLAVSALGLALHLLILDTAFGFDCLQTSFQMLYSIINLPNLNLGQLQLTLALAGLLSLLATISCTLYLSARAKDSLTALLLALALLLAPLFTYIALGPNWLSSLLPAAGLGLQNNLLYQLADFNFLHLGQMSLWTPSLILASAAIETPLFLLLAVRAYCKHQG